MTTLKLFDKLISNNTYDPAKINPNGSDTGLGKLKFHYNKDLSTPDDDLKFIKKLEEEDEKGHKLFNKPLLEDKWVKNYKDKLDLIQNIDFEQFVLLTVDTNTTTGMYYMRKHFKDILLNRLIPIYEKIEFHQKLALIVIRGIKSQEDYGMMYLINSEKIGYDKYLLTLILVGIGIRDLVKDGQNVEKHLDDRHPIHSIYEAMIKRELKPPPSPAYDYLLVNDRKPENIKNVKWVDDDNIFLRKKPREQNDIFSTLVFNSRNTNL